MTLPEGLFVGFVVAPTTLWSALAIRYHLRWPWLRWCFLLVVLAVAGASLWLLPLRPWGLAVWLGFVVTTILWLLSLRPGSDRDWATGMAVLPDAELAGDSLLIRQFRNFRYSASGAPLPQYEERTFDLTKLAAVDYCLSHWFGPVMAHTLVSFSFDDGQHLVLSVEARRQRWQSYSPLQGLFRCYELLFVLGDEHDIIRLRTNVRRERMYLYRVLLPREEVRRLLGDYLARIAMLATRPEWYNSMTNNCTTNLFYNGRRRVPWWMTLGIFLNGFSARGMYRLGFLDRSMPFKELQSRSSIGERALAAGDAADFSQQIRTHLATPHP